MVSCVDFVFFDAYFTGARKEIPVSWLCSTVSCFVGKPVRHQQNYKDLLLVSMRLGAMAECHKNVACMSIFNSERVQK